MGTNQSSLTDVDRWALYDRYLTSRLPFPSVEMWIRANFGRDHKSLYKSYVHKHHPTLARNMMSKFFWYSVFLENDIPQPRMFSSCINGRHQVHTRGTSNTGYIVKPDRGLQGVGVRRVDQCTRCVSGNDWVCQERVPNCGSFTEHYRVVTLWNGRLFSVSLMRSGVPDATTSNLHQGGTSHMLCFGGTCETASLPDPVVHIARRLRALHRTHFSVVFSIGWDIIVACEEGRGAVALEGNLNNGGAQWDQPANDAYREEVRTFIREHPQYL